MTTVNTTGAAALLGVPPKLLRAARERGVGPPYRFVAGSGYLYQTADVEAWREKNDIEALEPRPKGKVLRFNPDRGAEEWFDLNTETFLPIKRSTDPRYVKDGFGGYKLR
jgi:hypothetical protein